MKLVMMSNQRQIPSLSNNDKNKKGIIFNNDIPKKELEKLVLLEHEAKIKIGLYIKKLDYIIKQYGTNKNCKKIPKAKCFL